MYTLYGTTGQSGFPNSLRPDDLVLIVTILGLKFFQTVFRLYLEADFRTVRAVMSKSVQAVL